MKLDLPTLLLQTANVLLLLWLLQRFLYRPIQDMLARRQALSTQRLQEVQQARDELEVQQKSVAAERQALHQTQQNLEEQVRSAATASADRLLAQAREAAQLEHRRGQEALSAERRQAESSLRLQSANLAVDVAQRLLARLPPDLVFTTFLDEICRILSNEGPGEGSSETLDVELRTATALSEAQQRDSEARLRQALGRPLNLRFSVDASLLAGLEVHLPQRVLRNHWSQDLARVLATLQADEHTA